MSATDVTLKFFLNTKKTLTDGSIPIYLRITENRKYQLKSTGISVHPKHWNPTKQEVRKGHPSFAAINMALSAKKKEAREIVLNASTTGVAISKETVKEAISKKPDQDFFEFTRSYLTKIRDENFHRGKKVAELLFKVEQFHGKKTLAFSQLTPEFIEELRLYLVKSKKNSPNTIKRFFITFKMLVREAISTKLLRANQNPFISISFKGDNRSTKIKLESEQIKAIAALNLTVGAKLWHTRNQFLFSFYCAGIRFGDICQLRWGNIVDGNLKYRMSKTGSELVLPLMEPAKQILESYRGHTSKSEAFIFPLLKKTSYPTERELKQEIQSRNAVANRNLKILARMAGIEETVSFHVSRHSYANYTKSKMDLYSVSKALGHTKLSTTQIYLSAFDESYVSKSHLDALREFV